MAENYRGFDLNTAGDRAWANRENSFHKAIIDAILDRDSADISVDTTNFDGNLSSADDTIQKAFETLNNLSTGSSAAALPTNTSNFNNLLSAADNTAQKAFDTIDDAFGSPSGIAKLDANGLLDASQYPHEFFNVLSNGVVSGGELSINIDTSKYDISDGEGMIVDNWTDPLNPTFTSVTWSGLTAQVPTYIATHDTSFVAIDSNGDVVNYNTFPDNELRRDVIFLGKLVHRDNVNITIANTQPDHILSPLSQTRDLFGAVNLINIEGNVISANGANLNINKSAGKLFGNGINYAISSKDPHTRTYPAATPATLRYFTQAEGSEEAGTTTVQEGFYDNAGTKTAVPNKNWTSQRIFLFASGKIAVQYGQKLYGSRAEALAGVQNDPFIKNSDIEQNAILIGILLVEESATNLSNLDQARFLTVSKFGESVGASAGTSVSTLQNAYDNSETPEIVLDDTRGALTLNNGVRAASSNVLEIEDENDALTAYIKSDGTSNIIQLSTVTTTTIDYNASIGEVVLADSTSTNVTVTLPANPVAGAKIVVKKIASPNLVIVDTAGTETIDGDTTWTIQYAFSTMQLVSNGTNWYIV